MATAGYLFLVVLIINTPQDKWTISAPTASERRTAMGPCNKDCIANVCGECAAEKCEGQIQRLEGYHSAEKATWAYKIAVDSFHDYFGKREATHE